MSAENTFRFILEEPSSRGSAGDKQRKRARLVTACDNCRVKKIKCIRVPGGESDGTCDACKVIGSECLYSDRERYQSTQGQRFDQQRPDSSSSAAETVPISPIYTTNIQTSSEDIRTRKRKASTSDEGVGPNPLTTQFGLPSEAPKPYASQHVPATSSYAASMSSSVVPSVMPMSPAASLPLSESAAAPRLERITVPFFRYFGPTANTPGYRKIKVRALTLSETNTSSPPTQTQLPPSPNVSSNPYDFGHPHNPNYPYRQRVLPDGQPHVADFGAVVGDHLANGNESSLFDPQRPRYPASQHLLHLIGLFFDYLACHFPFLDRREVMEAAEQQTLPAVLANCMASLACRFSDRVELARADSRASAGVEYADMSKLLIVHMLSWPSLEVLQALVLIAWSEFGSGRDSGLWMYSRMAVAMAMDLGLQFETTVRLAATESEQEKVRLTWWSVLLIDRINSWGTGRPIAIADDQFDTILPLPPHDGREDIGTAPSPSLVFGHLASLVMLRGKMGDVLNSLVKRNSDIVIELELNQLQYEMTTWYQSLPSTLVFNIHNFRRFSSHNQSSTFLLLHCMFHSVITLLHRPSLLQRFTPDVTLPLVNSLDLSRSSARSLVDMISLADEMDENSLIANPFLDLPILTAARAFLAERETLAKPPENMSSMTVTLMRQWSEMSLERCKDALKKMSKFWGGVGCVKKILDQQSAGNLDFDVGVGSSGDSHVAHLRDVELMTQWATKAWRRQVGTAVHRKPPATSISAILNNAPAGMSPPASSPNSAYPYTNGMNGMNGNGNYDPFSKDSPEGAAVGISGVLDGPFMPRSSQGGFPSSMDALRVSFNSAEADLSFPNMQATQLLNIPEGLEEFLGSTLMSGTPMHLLGNRTSSSSSTSLIPNGGSGGGGGGGSAPGLSSTDMSNSIQPFSTLIGPWFPMGQFSRAPSPVSSPYK
ncbi:hypothetical protein FRB94_008208 [Tulasnella sp. JGI-2019a]|nr:hypothetical protein FRB94_008208 [Tulasnella sp. JGI-2019a]